MRVTSKLLNKCVMNLKLGSLSLSSKAILSPMESVSDIGFRNLCYSLGASLTWTEMIRADALCRNNKATLDLIDTFDSNTLTGIQLLVKSPDSLKLALQKIEELSLLDEYKHFNNIAAIDLNFGCPSLNVINEGAGPSLLKRRKRIFDIFQVLIDYKAKSILPKLGAVGCKIRLGLNQLEQDQKVYLPVIHSANELSLDYMVIHARHAKQRSRDLPTWAAIGEIKNIAKIPIIGNGNVFSSEDATTMMKQTNCDGIMIARAAIQNPWIFKELSNTTLYSNIIDNNLIHCNTNQNYDNSNSNIPLKDDIQQAYEKYLEYSIKYKTKEKYIDFHKKNFHRMLHNNVYQNFDILKNIHMS